MPEIVELKKRLEDIAHHLRLGGNAFALLGLGSAGKGIDRMDQYSDLDFFIIAKPGHKHTFLDPHWYARISPTAFIFKNSSDGFKIMYQDGIFCEMAVFEPSEMEKIPFADERVIWKEDGFDTICCVPKNIPPPRKEADREWAVGELLTNLYVGLCRFRRGEKISGMRFVQNYAVDRILEMAGLFEKESDVSADHFGVERRFEARFPGLAKHLPFFMQGYENTPESAIAILEFVKKKFAVDPVLEREIRKLSE